MRNNGFQVDVIEQENLAALKDELGVPGSLRSCHTAVIEGHVIEGHVPAAVVRRFLAEETSSRGLAVPGMPVGSPGMEMGDRFQAYSVIRFDENGQSDTFTRISSADDQR